MALCTIRRLLCFEGPTRLVRSHFGPALGGYLKFNVGGVGKGKPKLASCKYKRRLCNGDGLVLAIFSKHVGILESNEANSWPYWRLFASQLEFQHVERSANAFPNSLAKQRVDRSSPFVLLFLLCN